MGRREDFDNALWSDPDFLALSPEARMIYIWTWTNARCGMAGIYKVAPAQVALETGYSVEVVLAALDELALAKFAFYETSVLFVRTRARRLRQKTRQIATAIKNDLANIADDHPLKARFLELYGDQPWLAGEIGEAGASIHRLPAEPQSNPLDKPNSRPSPEPREGLYGNGNGTGKGNGSRSGGFRGGKRTAPEPPKSPAARKAERNRHQRHAELLAHFPDEPEFAVLNAARALVANGEPATVDAIRAYLEGAAA